MHLAWETAAKLNDYDFYLWLNDDVTLHKGAISELLNDSSKKPDRNNFVQHTLYEVIRPNSADWILVNNDGIIVNNKATLSFESI